MLEAEKERERKRAEISIEFGRLIDSRLRGSHCETVIVLPLEF